MENEKEATVSPTIEELTRLDRSDEQAYRAAVRTGDAALAGRMAGRWANTRARLVQAQLAANLAIGRCEHGALIAYCTADHEGRAS